jgi:hypothetical protein
MSTFVKTSVLYVHWGYLESSWVLFVLFILVIPVLGRNLESVFIAHAKFWDVFVASSATLVQNSVFLNVTQILYVN